MVRWREGLSVHYTYKYVSFRGPKSWSYSQYSSRIHIHTVYFYFKKASKPFSEELNDERTSLMIFMNIIGPIKANEAKWISDCTVVLSGYCEYKYRSFVHSSVQCRESKYVREIFGGADRKTLEAGALFAQCHYRTLSKSKPPSNTHTSTSTLLSLSLSFDTTLTSY